MYRLRCWRRFTAPFVMLIDAIIILLVMWGWRHIVDAIRAIEDRK